MGEWTYPLMASLAVVVQEASMQKLHERVLLHVFRELKTIRTGRSPLLLQSRSSLWEVYSYMLIQEDEFCGRGETYLTPAGICGFGQ